MCNVLHFKNNVNVKEIMRWYLRCFYFEGVFCISDSVQEYLGCTQSKKLSTKSHCIYLTEKQ